MSIEALNWAWRQVCPSASAKLVLMALADHADADGECWPAMKRLAVMAGISPRQVSTHITALQTAGLMEKVSRRRRDGQLRGWNYRLNVTSGSLLPVASGSLTSSPAEADFRSEPPENRQVELAAAPREKKPRRQDPIWDAIVQVCGYGTPPTKTEAGRAQAAGKELREINATPEQIHQVAAAYRRKWPDMPVTPQALTGNWSQLLLEATPRKAWSDTNFCPVCGQDADDIYHEELCDAYATHN